MCHSQDKPACTVVHNDRGSIDTRRLPLDGGVEIQNLAAVGSGAERLTASQIGTVALVTAMEEGSFDGAA